MVAIEAAELRPSRIIIAGSGTREAASMSLLTVVTFGKLTAQGIDSFSNLKQAEDKSAFMRFRGLKLMSLLMETGPDAAAIAIESLIWSAVVV